METNTNKHATNTKRETSMHVFMAMTGIVIAIICSLVLVREVNPGKSEAKMFEVTKSENVTGFQVSTMFSIGKILK